MATEGTPSYAKDIRPLFREVDQVEMEYAFDLWDHGDVAMFIEDIIERLADGTMPCDGGWSESQIQLLRVWREAGCPE